MAIIRTISTPQGEVKLFRPPVELLDSIHSFLPLGLSRYMPAHNGADYGIVIKKGENELFCVKQQPTDCDQKQSKITHQANAILMADSISSYLANSFQGMFMPFAYIRTKDAGRYEAGIAYFGSPSQQGRECQEYPYNAAYDGQFGHGFTTMMTTFVKALQQSSRNTRIPLSPTIGFEVRSWFQIGSFAFSYMLVGPHVICLKTVISEQDPSWTILKLTGISEIFHMPIMAAVLKSSANTN